jgi:hypothetical protein
MHNNFEVRHLRCVCNHKHDIDDSQNTTKYLFATAGVQDSNNYMFRPFLVAINRLYILSWLIVHNLETRNILVEPDDGH